MKARLMLVGVVLLGLVASTVTPVLAIAASSQKGPRLSYHDDWRKLWEDHITWTRVVILGILDALPGTPTYVGRLLQNPKDMADALKPYYADQADVLGNLITEHLVIAAELLTAAHNNDTAGFNDAKARWYDNANQIAVQMSQMNPQFWPYDASKQMWLDHLLKCCSNFDSIAIIDSKTRSCMVKGVAEPGVARPYSQTSYFSRPCSPHTLTLRPSFSKIVHSRESSYFRVL